MTTAALEIRPDQARPLLQEIMDRSGQNLLACYQCRRCAAGCPVGDLVAGVTPDRLIRMIVLGEKDQALNNPLVWKCTACYTCGTRCPNNIQTARITETLKQMGKSFHLDPLSPRVAAFHSAFMDAASHLGRVNELEFMGLYEMKNTLEDVKKKRFKEWFVEMVNQADLGLRMMKIKRMHFGLQRVKKITEVWRLFKKAKKKA